MLQIRFPTKLYGKNLQKPTHVQRIFSQLTHMAQAYPYQNLNEYTPPLPPEKKDSSVSISQQTDVSSFFCLICDKFKIDENVRFEQICGWVKVSYHKLRSQFQNFHSEVQSKFKVSLINYKFQKQYSLQFQRKLIKMNSNACIITKKLL